MAVLRSRAAVRPRFAACFLLTDLVYLAGAFAEDARSLISRRQGSTGRHLSADEPEESAAAGQEAAANRKYAYVTLWAQTPFSPKTLMRSEAKEPRESPRAINITEPDDAAHPKQLYNLVSGLNKVHSKYPLVVLTNHSMVAAEVSKYPNVVLGTFHTVNIKCEFQAGTKFLQSSQKLQVLGLTEYDKVLWVDADVDVQKNIDYLFNLPLDDRTIYTQANNWNCASDLKGRKIINSGFMLFRPSTELFANITKLVNRKEICPSGDQAAINEYILGDGFGNGTGSEDRVFESSVQESSGSRRSHVGRYGWKWRPFPNKTIHFDHCAHHHEDEFDALHHAAT